MVSTDRCFCVPPNSNDVLHPVAQINRYDQLLFFQHAHAVVGHLVAVSEFKRLSLLSQYFNVRRAIVRPVS